MIPLGLYERIINKVISQHLSHLDNTLFSIQTSAIDTAESSKILASYLALLFREVMEYIEGEGQVIENRIMLCNGVIKYIATLIERGEMGFSHSSEIAQLVRNHTINDEARLLLSLVERKNTTPVLAAQARTVIRPETSLAENSLFEFVDKPLNLDFDCPLDLYCSYTLDQILVALGRHSANKRKHFQEGVLYLNEKGIDVFFVTLNKSDRDYSPSTMYRDYAINEEQFHWQSQSVTTVESATGQRYINQRHNANKVLIFVRDYKKEGQMALPYTCIGLADYVSHYGSAPINIVWKMHEPIPGFVLKEAVTV